MTMQSATTDALTPQGTLTDLFDLRRLAPPLPARRVVAAELRSNAKRPHSEFVQVGGVDGVGRADLLENPLRLKRFMGFDDDNR